jgi:hypothetical protein
MKFRVMPLVVTTLGFNVCVRGADRFALASLFGRALSTLGDTCDCLLHASAMNRTTVHKQSSVDGPQWDRLFC